MSASSSDFSVRQKASARSHISSCGRYGRFASQAKVVSSGATKPDRPPISMLRLHKRHALLDRHGAGSRTCIFDDVAARASDAELGDQPQCNVLRTNMRSLAGRRAVRACPRPFHRHHLRRENVRHLAGADAESQRANAADGTGVAVRNCVRCAWQHDAEFRCHDVGNALLRIARYRTGGCRYCACLRAWRG